MNKIIEKTLNKNKYSTPFILLDKAALVRNCKFFTEHFGSNNVFFSVKANNDLEVMRVIAQNGINFDVASKWEIDTVYKLGISPNRLFYSAPTKIPSHIKYAYESGIRVFAADSKIEVDKLAELAPGAKVMLRIEVDNAGSEWPLIKKFGVTTYEAFRLFKHIKSKNLVPYGITFHVGSQNSNPSTWDRALARVKEITDLIEVDQDIKIKIIDIGGGFPAQYNHEVPEVIDMVASVQKSIKEHGLDDKRIVVEPGRSLVGETAYLFTQIINRAKRGLDEWLYLDIGAYNGLQETLEGFSYEVITLKDHQPRIPFTLCGPSCDSTDKFMEGVVLPKTLTYGDVICFKTAGAYTNSYKYYNGLTYPKVKIIE